MNKDEILNIVSQLTQNIGEAKTIENIAELENKIVDKLYNLFSLNSISVSLPLVEVDKEILKICIDAYNNGEKLTAIKTLRDEAKNKLFSFGLRDAERFLKGYEH